MPYKTIKTKEYECIRCGYRWIRRKNGNEIRGKPRFCPECKTRFWDESYVNNTDPSVRSKKWYQLPRGLRRLKNQNKNLKPVLRPLEMGNLRNDFQ